MYIYVVNRIFLIFLFSLFSYADQNINIKGNIIIPINYLLESVQIQKDEYFERLVKQPFIDKEFYLALQKIKLAKKETKIKLLETAVEKSMTNNSNLTNYFHGLKYFILKDYDSAFPFLKKASRQGNRDALFLYALYFTPYLGNDVNIPRFYFLLMQSIIGQSKLPFVSQIRWWKEKKIKPLLVTNRLVRILETDTFVTIKNLKELDEYVYIPPNIQTLKKNDLARIAHLTLLFKAVFFFQGRLASLDKQDLSKITYPSSLSTFLKESFSKFSEKKCTKTKPYYLYTNNYQPEDKCGKKLPFKKFIKKIKAGYPCLISNRKAHHFLFVYSINYETRKIYFIDGWPQNSFLLEKNNILGLKGKIIKTPEGNLIELSFDDYKYIAVGCASLDTLSDLNEILPKNLNYSY